MLERYLGEQKMLPLAWNDLSRGAPTIIGLASLACQAFASDQQSALPSLPAVPNTPAGEHSRSSAASQTNQARPEDRILNQTNSAVLSEEAATLLYRAKDRGIFAIQGAHQAFDSIGRMLCVFVEIAPDQQIRFGDPRSTRQTIRFLEGFEQLCRFGLVVHQTDHEFAMTTRGFELAEQVDPKSLSRLLALGVDPNRTEW